MFGLFKKKSISNNSENQYAGQKFGPFLLDIPENWICIIDNGTLRAHINDVVRLNVSIRDMSLVQGYSPDDLFETIKAGYYNSDINWAAYSSITKGEDFLYQTLEYLDDPRLILALVHKVVDEKEFVLVISFAGNTGKDVEMHISTFNNLIRSIEVLI